MDADGWVVILTEVVADRWVVILTEVFADCAY